LPDNRQRQQQELEFWSALGAALRFVKGQATPEMGNAFFRARELWEQLGAPSEFLHISYGQSRFHMYRGEFDLAQRLDEDLLRLSRQRNDNAGLILGHQSSGRNLMLVGRFASARSHLEKVLALYDPTSHRPLGHQTGSHPRVGSRGYLGIALFCLGFPDQALAQSNAGIDEALTLAHPPSLAASLAMGARLLSLGEDNAALDERARQLMAVATEQGFPLYHALGTIYSGWTKVKTGEVAEGISLLRSGSNAYRATGAESRMPYYIALLAKACEMAGQIDEAITLLGDALHIAGRIGERWFTAELYRHQGQLMLRQGESEAASELYYQALTIAQEQEAKLWELRAAVGLASLRRDQRRRSEAYDVLAPVYGWFTEGFATQDFKSAKALIGELS
jgi:predicted ATPase